jgi:hypothetical protein
MMLIPMQSLAADIRASLDRSTITEGETVSLILVSQGSVDDDPDFSVLEKDFEILGQSQQSSYQFINGKGQSSKQWVLKLKPRHEGVIKIPSISFGKDTSPSLRLKVTQAVYDQETTASKDFMLNVTTDTEQAYVNAQIIVTLQLMYSRNFNNGNLSDLNIKGGGQVKTQPLGEPARYEKTINGIPYNVYEVRYALFPEQASQLVIEPMRFEAEVGPAYSSLFDPLNRQATQRIRLQSEARKIDILPRPEAWAGAPWLPATKLTLEEEWSDLDQLAVGNPVTRTVVLRVTGQPSSQIAELITTTPSGIKAYPDQAVLEDSISAEGINGLRKEQLAYIPEQGGEIQFPALKLRWWNTRTQTKEIAEIPARTVLISGNSSASKTTPSVIQTNEDETAAESSPDSQDEKPSKVSIKWMGISLLLGLGWLLTIFYFWRRRAPKIQTNAPVQPDDRTSSDSHLYDLKTVCQEQNRHQFRLHILSWARKQWPHEDIRGLEDIGKLAGEPLQSLLHQIDEQYAKNGLQSWPCDEIIKATTQLRNDTSNQNREKDSLMPLYP